MSSFELTIENRLEEIDRVNDLFNAFSRENKIADSIRRKFNAAFDELLNNIISYAYEDQCMHQIEVKVSLQKWDVVAEIIDDGIPFNLFKAKTPDLEATLENRPVGGLGIHLVRSLMDICFYERKDGKNRNVIIKNLQITSNR